MAITVNVTTGGSTTTQTVASGASIQLSPSSQVQIIVDGVVIDPATLQSVVNPPDVTFTLPDGQQITLLNFVDLQGGAGGGLVDGTGTVTIASALEDLTTPAAGPQGGDDGGAPDGDGNLSTFNQATISEFAEFGSGTGGAGPDLPPGPPAGGDEGDDFELIIALPPAPGEPPVVIVVPLVPTIPPETPETPDTPPADIPDPTLAVLLINEIGLPSNPTGTAFIELANQSDTAQTSAGNLLTVVGPGGTPVVIALPEATIPVGGKLVVREDGSFEVFDAAGGSIAAGTYTTPAWGLGTDTTEPIGVNLSFAGTEIDTFQANGIEFANGGWTSNTAGTAELAGTPFESLFDLDGFSGFSGDIDTVLSSLGLSRPVVSPEALGDVPNPHPEHPPETEVNNTGFSRVFGGADGTPSDTDSEADWTTSNTPTEGSDNAAPGDVNPQDETSPDDFDPAQNAGTNDPDAGQTVLIGEAEILYGEVVLGDSLEGGRGPDFLFGTPAIDLFPETPTEPKGIQEISLFYGGLDGGNDILAGGDHNDFLYGNTGADLLSGGVVTDSLIGGSGGADILVDFDDIGIFQLSGIYGGYGFIGDSDVLVGGNGEDLLLTRDPSLDGGEGENGALVSEFVSEGFYGGDLLVGDNIGELTRVEELVTESGGTGQEVMVEMTLPFGGISEFSGLEDGDRDVIIAGGSSDVIFGDNLGISTFLDSAPSDSLLDLVEGGLSNPALSWTLMGLQSDLGWRHHTNSYGEADNIDAGAGNDLVFGQGGNDEILGGAGIDVIYGGAGDDWIDVGDGLVGDSVGSGKGAELAVGDDLAVGGSGSAKTVFVLNEITDGPIMPPEPEVTGGNDVILGDYRGDTLIGDGIVSVGSADPFVTLDVTEAIQTDALWIGGAGPAIAGGDDLIIGNGGGDLILGDGLVELQSIFAGRVFSLPVEGVGVTGSPFEGGTALIGGDDTLYGGDGRDVIYGEGNLSTVEFDPGDGDWKNIGAFEFLLSGAFDGQDTLYGGDAGDRLYGNGGNDTIFGDNGDGSGDTVYGDDKIYGNAGDDLIYGEQNGDEIYGDDGGSPFLNPLAIGGPFGGTYNDTLYGGDGAEGDTVYGNQGDDQVYGDGGDDTLYGDDGLSIARIAAVSDVAGIGYGITTYNDTLYGGSGADTVYGNLGDDLIVYKISDGPGVDLIYGDDGTGNFGNEDTLLIVNDSGAAVEVKVQPSGNTVNGTEQVEVLVGNEVVAIVDEVEDIVFQAGDDGDTFLLYGDFDPTDVSPTTFIMYGGAGDDALYGADLMSEHHILAYGGGGNDFLEGGDGNDDLYGGTDTDTLYGDAQSPFDVSAVNGLSDDNLVGDDGDDILYGDLGETFSDALGIAYGGADSLDGGDGNDVLYGDAGDSLDGGEGEVEGGADVLYGGNGENQLFGDAGLDLIVNGGVAAKDGGLVNGGADFLGAGSGNDRLFGDAGRNIDGIGSPDTQGGDDTLEGGEGDNQLYGDAGNDLLSGLASVVSGGSDTLTAGSGADALYGDAGRNMEITNFGELTGGSDLLYGGGGNDSLYGDAGNDLIEGGDGQARGGDDVLYGGAGDDDLFGDAGGDMIGSGVRGGADTIYGEGGGDFIFGDAGGTIYGGTGGDDVIYGGDLDGASLIAGDATVLADGAQGGDDLIYGGANVSGDADAGIGGGSAGGNDEIHGSDTLDLIEGDTAGSIDDGSYGGADLVYGGGGNDQITGDAGVGGSGGILFSSFAGDDTLHGDDGDDQIYGDTRGEIDETSVGGDDILSGGIGNDTLYGDSGGNDNLNGGNDTLHGGADDDTLYGGSGTDLLYGDTGADTFSIDESEAAASALLADQILDFETSDTIQFTGVAGVADIETTQVGGDVHITLVAGGAFLAVVTNATEADVDAAIVFA